MSGNEDDIALFSEFLKWKRFQEQSKRPAIESGGDSSVGPVTENPSTTGDPDTVPTAKCPAKATSADEYLSCEKKFSTAKKVFRHILKKSSQDAKCWGNATLKEFAPAQRKHIHDRVVEECPGLKGHAREIDLALAKSLSEAKYYAPKKAKKGQKRREVQKKKKGKDGKGDSKLTKTVIREDKRGMPTKTGSTEKGGTNTADLSDYERSLLPRKMLNKALRNAVKNSTAQASSQAFSPGDEVLLKYNKQSIGVGTFIKNVCDMFCEVGFRQHLLDEEDSEEAICLPIPVIEDVEARRKQKLVFSELEEDDVFTWKLERLEKNTPKGGYVVGLQQQKDMFAAKSLQGPRSRKPNSQFADYL